VADRLHDAVVLLTGASGGIGRALTHALLAAGVGEVICAGRQHAPTRERVTQETVDVTDAASVRALAERCGGRVDVVIACAGVNANRRLFTSGFEDAARREMEVNYFGLLNLAAAFAPAMQARGHGVFVHLLSVLAHVNLPLMASYSASKAAAHSFTQALRAELGRSGVQVCGVYPAVVDTGMSAHVQGAKMAPEDLAEAVVQAIRTGAQEIYPGAAEDVVRAYFSDPRSAEARMASRLP
jgi:NAD(P)-dependent dehydrogenase (short-subunit alcohol dehydrogenase family)